MSAPTLTAADRKELDDQAPEVLSSLDGERRRKLNIRYPKPTLGDVQTRLTTGRRDFESLHAQIEANRDYRYMRDMTPEKWRRFLEGDTRVHTRLSHNEILRVVASQTRNPYKVEIQAAGSSAKATERAEKQQRWANELMAAFERASKKTEGLRRPFCDAQNGDGIVAWEVFLTGSYDEKVDFEYREYDEPGEDGMPAPRRESKREYLARTEEEIICAGMPVGLRMVLGDSLYWDEDNEGLSWVLIHERKNYDSVYDAIAKRSTDKIEEARLPQPGTRGWPARSAFARAGSNDASGEVETIRFYNRRWYVYVVGGKLIDCEEHGMPGVPVFPCAGMVTSSPNISERFQGITWGMLGLESALNDILTLALDVAYTYSRPHPAIETDTDGKLILDGSKNPVAIDFSDPKRTPQLNPGQRVVDAFAGFQPKLPEAVTEMLFNLWGRSGQNPIAQGMAPGADVAGYTVNSLQGAALSMYGVLLENEARTWGYVVDFCRLLVRDTLRERWYLSVPMKDNEGGGTEWLGLGPDDVDETPCKVKIDPLSDAQRVAMRASLMEGWASHIISRKRVQTEGFGIQDTKLEDMQILRELGFDKLAALALDQAMQEAMPVPAPMDSGLVDASGSPLPSSNAGSSPGAMPAPVGKPTVGAMAASASQGEANGQTGRMMPPSRSMTGQANGYTPPPAAISGGRGQ